MRRVIFDGAFRIRLDYGSGHLEDVILVSIPSDRALSRGLGPEDGTRHWTPYGAHSTCYVPETPTVNPEKEDWSYSPAVTLNREEIRCAECYGTGFWRGFGGPCARGCKG